MSKSMKRCDVTFTPFANVDNSAEDIKKIAIFPAKDENIKSRKNMIYTLSSQVLRNILPSFLSCMTWVHGNVCMSWAMAVMKII